MIRGLEDKRLEVLISCVKTAKGRTNAILQPAPDGERPSEEMRDILDFLEDRGLIVPHGIGQLRITRKAVDVVEELEKKGLSVNDVTRDSRKVFIIYGRNWRAFEAVRDFLRSLGLEASDFNKMVEARGGSPYVGDVISQGMREMQAMVAVFTPDEHAELREEHYGQHDKPDDRARWQARPNVLFEAGMAMGIEETRTILVTMGKVSLPSDIDGRHVVRMSDAAQARDVFKGRLKAVGCDVKEQSDWLHTGNFYAAVSALGYESNSVVVPATAPATMSDDTARMKLRVWLKNCGIDDDTPVEFAAIDREAGMPAGCAEKLLGDVLGERWRELERGGGYIRLDRVPLRVQDLDLF